VPGALWFTDDEDACRLLAQDPFALLVGFALDQQITVQQAFLGPLRLKQEASGARPDAPEEERPCFPGLFFFYGVSSDNKASTGQAFGQVRAPLDTDRGQMTPSGIS
jgi:hypothetical protein